MGKLLLLVLGLLSSPILAMSDCSNGWKYSDQHKLIKGRGGVIMDYSYDCATSRWMLNSVLWSDSTDSFYTIHYVPTKGSILVYTHHDYASGDTTLERVTEITFEAYAKLDLKNGVQ